MTSPWFRVQRCGDVAHVLIGDNVGCFSLGTGDVLRDIGDARTIELSIRSVGGDARVALELFDALAGKVATATIVERCGSSAVILALATERIKIFETARVLVHAPSLAVLGSATDLRQSASFLDVLTARWRDIIAKRVTVSPETVQGWLSGPDVWFDAQQALAAGLVHEVLPSPAEPETADAVDMSIHAGSGIIDDGSEKLLLELLRAIGPVQTRDRRRLLRDLGQWAAISVFETTKNLPVENRVLIRSCATGHGDGADAQRSARVDNFLTGSK